MKQKSKAAQRKGSFQVRAGQTFRAATLMTGMGRGGGVLVDRDYYQVRVN